MQQRGQDDRAAVVADPGITRNTHVIEIRGKTGSISVKLENVPAQEVGLAETARRAFRIALVPQHLSRGVPAGP